MKPPTKAEVAIQQEVRMLPPITRPAKRKRREVILEEDEWLSKLEAIIQRDFFPDIPQLEDELEYLEAAKTQDPGVINEALNSIAKRKARKGVTGDRTPAHFATPDTEGMANHFRPATEGPAEHFGQATDLDAEGPKEPHSDAPKMSLDQFMALHNSEDNHSFEEILEGVNRRRRERYAWLYNQIQKDQRLAIEGSRPQDGYGTTGQADAALLTWPFEPKNTFFYDKDAVPYSGKELANQVMGPPKQIQAFATRLPNPNPDSVLPAEKKAERGSEYQEIATPSFTPGPDAPPLMTWGTLAATPLRLDSSGRVQTPIPQGTNGPSFHIQERKKRELVAQRYGNENKRNF